MKVEQEQRTKYIALNSLNGIMVSNAVINKLREISQKAETIIGKLKNFDKFMHIKRIQCPKPDVSEKLDSFKRLEHRYTYDNKPIYQMVL